MANDYLTTFKSS